MPTQRKVDSVSDLTDKMKRMQLAVVADYRGLSVAEISDLRKRLREHGAEFIVAKNTLISIAARETGNDAMESLLAGPTAVAFAYDNISKVAKTLEDYLRTQPKITVRGGLLGRNLLPANGLEQVTKLPSREQALAGVLGGIQAPVAGVVGVINAAISNVVYVLQGRIDQMQPPTDSAAA